MTIPMAPTVDVVVERLLALLQRCRHLKTENDILPPLQAAELMTGSQLLLSDNASRTPYAIIEAAARHVFHGLLASASIEEPQFVQMWNLLDILQICGDADECDPALALWLIEELLDSQSIDGCRKVFKYLESRRETLVAKNFMKNKNLVVLRMCNELLRRLSRAEDAVFCGRVFIFLFQSFPLGDKSSVNLRGEFHVENATTFEETTKADELSENIGAGTAQGEISDLQSSRHAPGPEDVQAHGDRPDKNTGEVQSLESENLYLIFWRLQQAFSNPTLLFKREHLDDFKQGLESTILKFKQVPRLQQSRKAESNRSVKRKHDEQSSDAASNLNPKYLTSRDLFELELSDLDFQRYFLVQALILIDFLLSLTESARTQLAHVNTQKSMQYPFTLSEDDMKWALLTRDQIHDYVRSGGSEEEKGRFFIRMVDTILQRDQNWVIWKMESCPPIAREPIQASDFLESKVSAQRICVPRRLRAAPMGALDLTFLSEADKGRGLAMLQDANRFTIQSEESLIQSIDRDELDLDFAEGEAKEKLQESMASKTWKTLRIAARSKLIKFDKVDEKRNLKGFLVAEVAEEVSERFKEGPQAAMEGQTADETVDDQANQEREESTVR